MTYIPRVSVIDASGSPLPVVVRSTSPSGNAINVEIGDNDILGNIPVFMDFDQHQVHEGESFHHDFYNGSLGSGANKDIRLVVPNITITSNAVTQCPHFRWTVDCIDLATVSLYEGATFSASASGSLISPIAMERNGTYSSLLQLYEDPIPLTTGSLIDTHHFMLAATNQVQGGGNSATIDEFVLKNNTQYLFRVNSGAASNRVAIDFIWYEDKGS